MRETKISFAFDYVDPGSYLVSRLLERWGDRIDTVFVVTWTPLELRVPPASLLDPSDKSWLEMTRDIQTQAHEERVPFVEPKCIPWTRKAHELAFHAREKGCFEPIHRALFEAQFVEPRDIGRIDVLVEIAGEHGLDAGEARTVLGVDRFRSQVEESRAAAGAEGIRGVPTLELPGARFEGVRGPGSLESFLTDVLRTESEPRRSRT